ncbi:MAG: Eco57I restriction-modification methylase domain-containing protein [Promethearchaeota archaeon]
MQNQKNFKKFQEFIELFDKSISTNNFNQINEIFSSINKFEELFIGSYLKKKKEGMFYTNENISDFIVKETLIHLITKKLKNDNNNFQGIQEIEEIYKLNSNFKQKVINLLLNVKICDPACGSGIFLLSCAALIFRIIKGLNFNKSDYDIKIKILENLVGYDINEYAIKLCIIKLFIWLNEDLGNATEKSLDLLKANIKTQNSILSTNIPKYDIIIGNPPYGNILNQSEKEFLKAEKIFFKDVYCVFILKALEWSKGVIGLLTPKSFLLRQGYIQFREKLLSKANILKIIDIGSKVFKDATNEVQIIIYEKKNENLIRDLKIYDFPKNIINTYHNQNVDSLRICFNLDCPLCLKSKKLYVYTYNRDCPYCNSNTLKLNRIRIKTNPEVFQIINNIENIGDLNYLNPIDFPKMIRGEEDKGLRSLKRILRNDISGSCFFVSARNDFTYYRLKKNKSFNIEELDTEILKGNNYEYYTKPKLLIKHNNIIPEAIYSEENVCFTSSIYSLLHDDVAELKYLCAILNSILIQFYCIYAINNQKDTTINLNQYMIRHLPIVKSNGKIKNIIIKKVNEIYNLLYMNKGFINKDIYQIIRQIDDIIFNLYSIKKIERDLIISKTIAQINYFRTIYNS